MLLKNDCTAFWPTRSTQTHLVGISFILGGSLSLQSLALVNMPIFCFEYYVSKFLKPIVYLCYLSALINYAAYPINYSAS